jgi:hypothetical protein
MAESLTDVIRRDSKIENLTISGHGSAHAFQAGTGDFWINEKNLKFWGPQLAVLRPFFAKDAPAAVRKR